MASPGWNALACTQQRMTFRLSKTELILLLTALSACLFTLGAAECEAGDQPVSAKNGALSDVPAVVTYYAPDQFPESADWDYSHKQFFIGSLNLGNIATVSPQGNFSVWVQDDAYAGNSTVGMKVDNARNRVIAVVFGTNPHTGEGTSYGALAAYDLTTKDRVLYSRLDTVGPQDSELGPFPNDVAVDSSTGNLYVTDSFRNLITKVESDTGIASVLTASPVFVAGERTCVGTPLSLNGIVYHPDGFLLTAINFSGALVKVTLRPFIEVTPVTGALVPCADGMRLRSDGRLVISSADANFLIESTDNWTSARVVQAIEQEADKRATAIVLVDDKAYVNYDYIALQEIGNDYWQFNSTAADFAPVV